MRNLKNIFVIILVVVVLIGGGAMGYLWYSTKQQVDQIATAAQSYAQISYGGITVSPEGFISINQLRMTPHFANDTVAIGAIRLNTPNLLALLKLRWQFSQGQLPAALSLSYQDIELPLQGDILNAPVSAAERSPLDALEALGCGPVSRFGGAEWQEMGYNRLVSDAEIGYRLDAAHSRLELRVDNNFRDGMTVNLDLDFVALTRLTTLADLAALTPRLAKLNIAIRDNGFNQRRNRYCAAKANKPINDYLADHVRLVVERLRASGINPGPGLIAAYQGYLIEGGELIITAIPPAPINPAELSDYSPADVIKLLGLTLKVNNTAITDLTVGWDVAKIVKAFGVEPKPTLEEIPAPVILEKPVVIQKTYHPTPISALSQHQGKVAKLRTTTGIEYRGQLDAMVEGVVRITIRKPGGSVTLSLRTSEIASAEVLY